MLSNANRLTVPALALGLLGGCAAQSVSQVGERPREAITYAARARYTAPAQASERVAAVAITDDRRKELNIYNLGSQAVPATAVWVNGAFVRQIDPIPPGGRTTLRYGQLLEAGPGVGDLSKLGQTPQRVELQTENGLFRIHGPVAR
jgi:hypothetical protein